MPLEDSSSATGPGSCSPILSPESGRENGAPVFCGWCAAGSLILQRLNWIELRSAGSRNGAEYNADDGWRGEGGARRPVRDGKRIDGEDADAERDRRAVDTA